MLELLGLDAPTEAVYRAMLADPGIEASALAERLGVPEDSVRAAWRRLAELSLARHPAGDPRDASAAGPPRAVRPEIGLEYLLTRRQAEFAAARAAAERLISEYEHLRPADPPVGVEHLASVDEIRARLAVLTEDVRTEVMAFAPGGPQTEANMAASRPLNERLLTRGVTMRTIYLESVRNSPASVAHATWLTELGGQVRTVATLPLRMTVVDRTTAVIPVDSDDSGRGGVVLTGQGVLTALCALFETVWANARPLGEAPRRDEGELDDQEAATLRLLAEGHTDEGIAKRLGVSHRTARRIATVLMDRLGARSRFEAGARAVQRGWLPRAV
ncbi:helix-turn-helix transcriptional regulator [Streptomyces sp. P9(2023)]|uniref:helix-turn-helix transcriptional regulator n=1 Tax=Streptomyces sp. P9(2023) TaxID=3064394 RepID=UPI0028F42700|nr:helix-turn-helix transcriptional regulator [Streptomyces sp. P9(2023)]MDT9689573.1 helix-turn-helix transcriptional regulator [Streptomyces sp. P9(2023)]